jgi:hypothetical protein
MYMQFDGLQHCWRECDKKVMILVVVALFAMEMEQNGSSVMGMNTSDDGACQVTGACQAAHQLRGIVVEWHGW